MNRVYLIPSLLLAVIVAATVAASFGCSRKPEDARISTEIQSKFNQDSGLSTKQLTIEASHGVVTLAGFVDNEAQRTAAARQAASVAGVQEVVNNLQVGSAAAMQPAPPAIMATQKTAQGPPLQPAHKPAAARKPGYPSAPEDSAPDTNPSATDADDAVAENSQPPAAPASDPADNTTPPPSPPPLPLNVTIEQGTPISIRLIDSIDSEKNQIGDRFHASLNAPLSAEGSEAVAQGTDVTGHIVDLRSAGKFKGQSLLVLQLDSIASNGKSYDLQTDQYRKEGNSRGKSTTEKVGGGAILGGIIGAIAGGGKGAAIGSAAGAGVGGGAQAASKSQQIKLPSETILNFTLQAPVTVVRPPAANPPRPKLEDPH